MKKTKAKPKKIIPKSPPKTKRQTTKPVVSPLKNIEAQDDAFDRLFSIDNLQKTWRVIRRELQDTVTRDAVDWLDWALTIDSSLPIIREQILLGNYVPSPATRVEAGKSKGSYRVLTALNVRDALIYRHISDYALLIALPRKVEGAYFSRRQTATPVGKTFGYKPSESDEFYAIWLRYNEYRSKTLLNSPYQILVLTDISNYFESVSHDLLFEYLAPLGLPRKAVGTLGRLLEAFRPDAGHSPSPKLGIPVDDLDCSRELAHIFLFEHDRRIVNEFGIKNYVRWMDDQNIGVRDMAEARKVVNTMTRSLSQQRLTLNSQKTKFLNPVDVTAHFQLEANTALSNWWGKLKSLQWKITPQLSSDLVAIWAKYSAGNTAGKGNWDKVLKRFYGYATRANLDFLEQGSLQNLIDYPELAERIFEYFARRNKGQQLLDLFYEYAKNRENLFELVENQFFESLLLLDPNSKTRKNCLALSKQFAKGTFPNQTKRPLGRATAILCLYWFGEKSAEIASLFSGQSVSQLPKEVARSWLACTAALLPKKINTLVQTLFGHPSDDVLRLVKFLQALMNNQIETFGNYRNLKERYPLPGKYYDARTWLILDLASQSRNLKLVKNSKSDFPLFKNHVFIRSEKNILNRVKKRLK